MNKDLKIYIANPMAYYIIGPIINNIKIAGLLFI